MRALKGREEEALFDGAISYKRERNVFFIKMEKCDQSFASPLQDPTSSSYLKRYNQTRNGDNQPT